MRCLEVEVAVTYDDANAGGRRERAIVTLFTLPEDAPNETPRPESLMPRAILAAIRHAKNRLKNYFVHGDDDAHRNHQIGCIKIGWYDIEQIGENGYCGSGRTGPFFEWKCDHSKTLEEIKYDAKAAIARVSAGS